MASRNSGDSGQTLSVLAVLLVGIWVYGKYSSPRPASAGGQSPVTVAVLDSGVGQQLGPQFQSRIDADGKNFADARPEVTDRVGHGSKIASIILSRCSECRVLPLKVTYTGSGITPAIVARAIDYAVAHGARVINFSFGMSSGSRALRDALQAAERKGVVLVSAVGRGFPNPYRPTDLSRVYPQRYPQAIVVNAVDDRGRPDLTSNSGEVVDLAVPQPDAPDEERGSSFAAARVSALVGRIMARNPDYSPALIRHLLRAASSPPPKPDFDHLGFGVLMLDDAVFQQKSNAAGRVYRNSGAAVVDLSSAHDIKDVAASSTCKARVLNTDILNKGRARLVVRTPGAPASCRLTISLLEKSGSRETLELKLTP